MDKESVLYQEISKLELPDLKKIAVLWNITKFVGKDKKHSIQQIMEVFVDEFYIKGVLEKLTPIQVNLYTLILKNKHVQTLGEMVRKVALPPLNVEMELNVLRKYHLIYQRKNRERLTNNLDKYHAFEEIAVLIKMDSNAKGEKFKLSLDKYNEVHTTKNIHSEWSGIIGQKKFDSIDEFHKVLTHSESIHRVFSTVSDIEKDVLLQIFMRGGAIEADVIRNYILINKGKFEQVIPSLINKYLVFDAYYIDEKFIRVITLPKEIYIYLLNNPLLPNAKKGTKQKQEKQATNELDFFLNIKKLVSYISRKGLSVAKSGKIKQADNKRTEQELLKPDLDIFPEKGQVYQIELILPVLKLLNYVELKNENIVFESETDTFQKKDIFELMNSVIHEINEARTRRLNPPEVFTAVEVPFYEKSIFDKCVKLIMEYEKVHYTVIMSIVIREYLVMSPGFKIKNFEVDLIDLRREIVSVIFYLHLFGFLIADYPDRTITLSELGKHYFQIKTLSRNTERGGITINPDFTIIAFPEKCSLLGIHLLKAFTELQDFDRVYTFTLTKDSYQQGILLGYEPSQFLQFLRDSSKAELSQNLLFLLEDWGKNLPIVIVTEGCVLVQTNEPNTMELLTGQIKGKKIIIQEVSPTAILIDLHKIQDVIMVSEKLNLIIKLIR